jgi:two-component system, LytTR family, sensor kinase
MWMHRLRRYSSPVFFALATYTCIRLVTDTYSTEQFWNRPWQMNAIEVGFTILTGYIIDFFLRLITKHHDRKYATYSLANITREFMIVLFMIILIINPAVLLIHFFTHDPVSASDIIIANVIVILFSLLYYAIVRGNNYVLSYIQQQTQLERLKTENLTSELNFLKAQYHPHFLFNALNTIYFQMDESVPEAKLTVEKFSELLRYQLYNHQNPINFGKELDHLNNFIHLQRQRTSTKLEVSTYHEECVNTKQIYPLLLLPLVENAFKYIGGNMKLVMESRMDGGMILFTVQNSLPGQTVHKPGGIGHAHLKKRLQLLYPDKHQFTIEHTKHYYKATLKLASL